MTRRDAPAVPGDGSEDGVALVELVNRTIDRGVLLSGDAVISVADVDLVRLTLDVILSAVDRFEPDAGASGRPDGGAGTP